MSIPRMSRHRFTLFRALRRRLARKGLAAQLPVRTLHWVQRPEDPSVSSNPYFTERSFT